MQNESSGKKALRAGLGYTIGNILVKGLTFISIPIFARLLSVADYGLYNTFGSYVTIMTFVVGLTLHPFCVNRLIYYSTVLLKCQVYFLLKNRHNHLLYG